MNTQFRLMLRRSGVRSAVLATGIALMAPAASPQKAASAPAEITPEKTHLLYMGADISVRYKDKLYRVRDVSGDSFIIDVNGAPVHVSFRGSGTDMKIEEALKLDHTQVALTNLKTERVYSMAKDPGRHMADNAGIPDLAAVNVDKSVGKINGAGMIPGAQIQDGSYAGVEAATGSAAAEMNTQMYQVRVMNEELAKELYDAISIAFELQPDQELTHPYVVVTARIHEKDSAPGEYKNWVLAKELNPMGPRKEQVRIIQGGLPPGYTIDNLHVHLYENGKEVPTTVSPKRVALSSKDAFQYLLIDYLATNKGATLRATPALATLPSDFRERLQRGEFQPAYYVKVTKDGLPGDAFLDQTCTDLVTDEYVKAWLKNVRFRPALDKGKAVDGVAKVVPGKL